MAGIPERPRTGICRSLRGGIPRTLLNLSSGSLLWPPPTLLIGTTSPVPTQIDPSVGGDQRREVRLKK
jgi:hypothetical protein